MWKRLSSPNTLPLIGAYMRGSELVMVSEWMKNGNVKQYLRQNPRVNKLSLVNCSPSVLFVYPFIDPSDSWRMLREGWCICIV